MEHFAAIAEHHFTTGGDATVAFLVTRISAAKETTASTSDPAHIDPSALCSDFGERPAARSPMGGAKAEESRAPSEDGSTLGSFGPGAWCSSAPESPTQLSPRMVDLPQAPTSAMPQPPLPVHLPIPLDVVASLALSGVAALPMTMDEPMVVPLAKAEALSGAALPAAPPGLEGLVAARPNNDGSVGHPYFCSRPCMFFFSGNCANTDTCSYCHAPHQKRPVHLDKRNRVLFDNMEADIRTGLLISLLFKKVMELDLFEEVQGLLEDLGAACGVTALERPFDGAAMKKSDRMLRSALASMAFRSLLIMLERTAGLENPAVAEATQALWTCCRATYDARGVGFYVDA